jgi:eukaryotic-like serine/threonine-protein kinase
MIAKGARLKDRYRLERLLGRGGMASVWLASDEVLERPVAVKVLSDTIASDPEFLARFRREAQVAAGLSHPNLIGVYDFGEGAERPYLVMEYVPGDNLAERMAQNGEVDCERLARELLGALAHIHAAGIVHRDIKPQNVLIAPDGSAKLIDFGIALPKDATSLTRTGHLLGTARYIAPEVMSGEPATERSDLYSCGVVLRDCVGDDPAGRLRALVERLSTTDPDGRPASAEAAATRIGRTRPVRDQPTEPIRPPEPIRPTLPRQRPEPGAPRRAWGKALALVGALAALAVAFLVVADGSQEERGGKTDPSPAASGPADAGATDRTEPEAAAAVPEPAGDDLALGSALNQEGFEMIQAGRYEEAVPVLEEAIGAFPPGTDDLNYAYALFNLGTALRLSGRPEEAIPVLERRLEIPNQTGVVRRELAAARRDASS